MFLNKSHYWDSIWLTSLYHKCHQYDIKFKCKHPFLVKINRTGSKLLLDETIKLNKSKAGKLKKTNYCQLYLQDIMLSDIYESNGRYIDKNCYNVQQTIDSPTSNLLWPHQEWPTDSSVALWKCFFIHLIGQKTTTPSTTEQMDPLQP